jgi:RND family efflux transporter MFP subunit
MTVTAGGSSLLLIRARRGIALGCAAAAFVAGCGQNQPQQAAPPPPQVTVAKPTQRTVSDYDEYVGRFVAVNSVEVRARVSGYLDQVHFKDGQDVKQGDLLFTIDKRPFQNAADQARANLALAKSNLAFTEADLARGQELVRDKTITQQIFEQRAQQFRNAQALFNNAEAALRQAALDLDFTELRSPINGRIGDRRVSPGNLVTGGTSGNTTLLATVVSTDPIYFEFTYDEASYLRYLRLPNGIGQDGNKPKSGMQLALRLIDEKDFSHVGHMDFVDNVIDRSTGTIRGRGSFANPGGVFTPGMFARVRVPSTTPYAAVLLPDTAIGTEQARKFVLTVNADNTVVSKFVTLGQTTPDGLRVIKDGIGPGDQIIVNGLMRARPGQKVTPQEQIATPPAQGAAQQKS